MEYIDLAYKLSTRSLNKLVGVNPKLVSVVKRAIEVTTIDFGVIQGLRTAAEQKALVAKGASQTMDSKHLTGNAVDVMAYIGSRDSWELNLYDDIAAAFRTAARELGVKVRWGAAWNIPDIRNWNGTMEAAMMYYVDERRKAGKRPFLDAGHLELN